MATRCAMWRAALAAITYQQRIFPTCYGIQFCHPIRYRDGPTATMMGHLFDRVCAENGIEHRLTKVKHPWTNGQVKHLNNIIEQDQRFIKKLTRPMMGFKAFRSASATLDGSACRHRRCNTAHIC